MEQRREQIRDILVSKPYTSLAELEERFPEVSSMTLRRDIEYFEAQGDVIKVRGGARAMRFLSLSPEDPFYKRSSEHAAEKERIARAAVEFIETGRSLFFDSGSTVVQMIPHLPQDVKLSVSTSDPNVALALVKNDNVVVNLVGGNLSRNNLSLSGEAAMDFVARTNIDVAFISPSGFSLECGFTSGNSNESRLKNAVIAKASFVVMMVLSRKIGKSMPFTFAQLANVDVLITDEEPAPEVRRACELIGVELIIRA